MRRWNEKQMKCWHKNARNMHNKKQASPNFFDKFFVYFYNKNFLFHTISRACSAKSPNRKTIFKKRLFLSLSWFKLHLLKNIINASWKDLFNFAWWQRWVSISLTWSDLIEKKGRRMTDHPPRSGNTAKKDESDIWCEARNFSKMVSTRFGTVPSTSWWSRALFTELVVQMVPI